MINQSLFARAQEIMADRYVVLSEDEMLRQLRLLLKRKGKLTTDIINAASRVPSASSYIKHFGSLRNAFDLIGYKLPRDCDWIDSRPHWLEVLKIHARQAAEALRCPKVQVDESCTCPCVTVNGKTRICFQVARQLKKRGPHDIPSWRIHRRKGQSGLLVVLRLGDGNKTVEDYLLLPAPESATPYLTLSDAALARNKAVRFGSLHEGIREIKTRLVVTSGRGARARPTPSNKRTKPSRPKTKDGGAPR